MAWLIYLSFLQEWCTCRNLCLVFRNTLCWFAFAVTCILGSWNRLLPIQASWLWIWAWKISSLIGAEKTIAVFLSFKENINLHQYENSFCFYGQYGHSVLVHIRSELVKWISWHPPTAFFSSHFGMASVYMNCILDEIKTGRWVPAANDNLGNQTRLMQVQYKKKVNIQSLPLFHSTDLLLFVLKTC